MADLVAAVVVVVIVEDLDRAMTVILVVSRIHLVSNNMKYHLIFLKDVITVVKLVI